jgi:DNA-directed RNA polymerase subunit RPC12/RpoP
VISLDDAARIQAELGRLAIEVVRVDVDGFIEASDLVGSPQALAAGIDPRAVTSAGGWAEMARLLKPFRDHAVARIEAIREEQAANDDELVEGAMACPGCGERRTDELGLNDDGSVVCATCGRRYSLAGDGGAE